MKTCTRGSASKLCSDVGTRQSLPVEKQCAGATRTVAYKAASPDAGDDDVGDEGVVQLVLAAATCLFIADVLAAGDKNSTALNGAVVSLTHCT